MGTVLGPGDTAPCFPKNQSRRTVRADAPRYLEKAMTRETTKQSSKDKQHQDTGKHDNKVPTYQEALDEAVEESFPASDPISPGIAEKADGKVSTPKDKVDWKSSHDKRGAHKK
jgi:hypothetical protein